MTDERYELNGETYQRSGTSWINSVTRIRPPQIIIQALDRMAGSASTGVGSSPTRTLSAGGAGSNFRGLQSTDFKHNITGTSWRARSGLGGLLAQALSDRTGRPFASHAVDRTPLVLIGRPPRFDSNNADKINYRKAKFYFRLAPIGADFGLYIEKEDQPMDSGWEWPAFVEALRTEAVTHDIEKAMSAHGLTWSIQRYEGDAGGPRTEKGMFFGPPLVQFDETDERVITWPEVADQLETADPLDWYDVFLLGRLAQAKAIALGTAIVAPVVDVYEALLPLYDACGR